MIPCKKNLTQLGMVLMFILKSLGIVDGDCGQLAI